MEDLIDWLRVQIDADARKAQQILKFSRDGYARGTPPEAWVAERKVNNVEPPYFDYQLVRTELSGIRSEEILRLPLDIGGYLAQHIAEFGSPRRVLAEIAAKRLRVDEIQRELGDDPTNETAQWQARVEAMPYADRDGFREEWRVEG